MLTVPVRLRRSPWPSARTPLPAPRSKLRVDPLVVVNPVRLIVPKAPTPPGAMVPTESTTTGPEITPEPTLSSVPADPFKSVISVAGALARAPPAHIHRARAGGGAGGVGDHYRSARYRGVALVAVVVGKHGCAGSGESHGIGVAAAAITQRLTEADAESTVVDGSATAGDFDGNSPR